MFVPISNNEKTCIHSDLLTAMQLCVIYKHCLYQASVSVKRIGSFLQTDDIDSRNVSHETDCSKYRKQSVLYFLKDKLPHIYWWWVIQATQTGETRKHLWMTSKVVCSGDTNSETGLHSLHQLWTTTNFTSVSNGWLQNPCVSSDHSLGNIVTNE